MFGGFTLEMSPQTSDWASFGDYIGGVLNPVVALTSVWLLFKAYMQTRETVGLLREQNAALSDSENLRRLERRMDGIVDEWRRFLSLPATLPKTEFESGSFLGRENRLTTCNFLRWYDQMRRASGAKPNPRIMEDWSEPLAELLHLLDELVLNLEMHGKLSETAEQGSVVKTTGEFSNSDYYKRRVQEVARILNSVGLVEDSLMNKLLVSRNGRIFASMSSTGTITCDLPS